MRAKLLSTMLSKQFKTPVEIRSVELSQNRIEIFGLKILTPEDSVFKEAFSMEYLRIQAGFFELLKKTRQIQEIFISGVGVYIHMYDQRGVKTNWSKIVDNMSDVANVKQETTPGARFIIADLKVQNTTLHLKRPNQNITVFPTISLHLKNLGSDSPLTLTEVIKIIVSQVMKEIALKYGLQQLFDSLLKQLPQKGVEGLKDTLEGVTKKIPFFKKSELDPSLPEPSNSLN
jgi:hypothetical protein